MPQDRKMLAVEEDIGDRISALPLYVIDLILARLPARCAARTCILSKKWRYYWAMHPNLELDQQFIKHLAVQSPSYFKQTVVTVGFRNLSQTSGVLQLIKSAPNLSALEIWVNRVSENVEAVSQYLKTPACLNRPLNKLKQVTLIWPMGSENLLLFTKLLLSHTPSLVRMRIRCYEMIGFEKELLRFPRASPKAELSILQ